MWDLPMAFSAKALCRTRVFRCLCRKVNILVWNNVTFQKVTFRGTEGKQLDLHTTSCNKSKMDQTIVDFFILKIKLKTWNPGEETILSREQLWNEVPVQLKFLLALQ